ncbi:MAG: hypothetical protein RBS43_00510 [Candidatus Cloacimonas sp.]|jgi:hypothetical protein|nr:hypothetical protein [Candidatus Cloacimonas sp.]
MKMIITKALGLVMGAFILMALGACRVDLDHEIWLNTDDSGRAKLVFKINFPRVSEEDAMDLGEEDNALENMAEKVRNVPGAKVIALEKSTNHTDEDYNFTYSLELSFDTPQDLQKALCIYPDHGISLEKTKGSKTLVIDTRMLEMQDKAGMDEFSEYIDMFNVYLSVKLNLPDKPSEIGKEPDYTADKKMVRWEIEADSDYYSQEANLLTVKY